MDIITDISTYNKTVIQNNHLQHSLSLFSQFTGSSIQLLSSLEIFDVNMYKINLNNNHKKVPYLTAISTALFDDTIHKKSTTKFIKKILSSNIKVNFYHGFEEFLNDYWLKINFINDDWFANNFNYGHLANITLHQLNRLGKNKILNWLNAITENNFISCQVTSYYHLHDCYGDRIIYEILKDVYKVSFPVESELEITTNDYKNITCFAVTSLDLTIVDKKILDFELTIIKLVYPGYNMIDLTMNLSEP